MSFKALLRQKCHKNCLLLNNWYLIGVKINMRHAHEATFCYLFVPCELSWCRFKALLRQKCHKNCLLLNNWYLIGVKINMRHAHEATFWNRRRKISRGPPTIMLYAYVGDLISQKNNYNTSKTARLIYYVYPGIV